MRCLLYSGCDRSVISKQFVQNVKLNSPEYELFAANKTRLPVDGDTSICLTIDGRLLTAKVSVSPAVDELLLGRDWLVENGCKWDFAAGTMHIGDQLIKTHQKKNVNTCRCVFVSEECEIPQRHKVSVPVRVVLGDLKDPSTEWATEPRVIGAGVVVARILLENNRTKAIARVLNYSDELYTLAVDSFPARNRSVTTSSKPDRPVNRTDEHRSGYADPDQPDRRAGGERRVPLNGVINHDG